MAAPPRAAIILRRSYLPGRWRGSVVYRDGCVAHPYWFVGDGRESLIDILEAVL